jgi:hypothetical protein
VSSFLYESVLIGKIEKVGGAIHNQRFPEDSRTRKVAWRKKKAGLRIGTPLESSGRSWLSGSAHVFKLPQPTTIERHQERNQKVPGWPPLPGPPWNLLVSLLVPLNGS